MIGNWNEAMLQRFIEGILRERFGLVNFNRITGVLGASQIPSPLSFGETAADPTAPTAGVVVYCIADDGAGKRALRALFPTGSPVTIATEP